MRLHIGKEQWSRSVCLHVSEVLRSLLICFLGTALHIDGSPQGRMQKKHSFKGAPTFVFLAREANLNCTPSGV